MAALTPLRHLSIIEAKKRNIYWVGSDRSPSGQQSSLSVIFYSTAVRFPLPAPLKSTDRLASAFLFTIKEMHVLCDFAKYILKFQISAI